jgi:hypothetical protein
MANTLIQIKRSTSTTKPSGGSLSAGEPAYSYSSNVMFIGTSDGNEVLAVGGKFYVDRTNSAVEIATAAFNTANAAGSSETAVSAFAKANSANIVGSSAFDKANTVQLIANTAFDKANSANVLAYNTSLVASASFDKANSANIVGSSAFNKANTGEVIANTAFDKANSANLLAYQSGLIGSASYVFANSSHLTANAAFDKANTAETIGIAAFINSNTKFSSSGGSITGSVAITGSLTVTGNVFSQDTTTLRVDDPLIFLAGNNYTSDIVDIGFIGNYVNATGSNVHTGLYREHEDKEYYLFQGYDAEPINNHIGAFSNNMTLAVLNADIKTSNLVLGGQNTITWITSAYSQANVGSTIASAAFNYANTVSDVTNAAFDKANSANLLAFSSGTIASAAFDKANTANVNAANASFLTTGIVATGVGGTGVTSFTSNGILFGNAGGALNVTSAGTEGQVLQAGSTGVPAFGHLDGGNF